jgi:formylglycine-generating enzyme required for sulfatase activity
MELVKAEQEKKERIRLEEMALVKAEQEKKRVKELTEKKASYNNLLKLGEQFTVLNVNLEMNWVKPGRFTMGSPTAEKGRSSDEKQHQVTLNEGFYLGKYEVTQAQWEKVTGSNPSNFKGKNLPVENVSWNDAIKFCNKLTVQAKGKIPMGCSFTLPTEAEWEYACRAGTSTPFSWGSAITKKQANYNNLGFFSKVKTKPVGSFSPNQWGFHDMHGNIREWTADWYREDLGDQSKSLERVCRGGSWDTVEGERLRSSWRDYDLQTISKINTGFRISLKSIEAPTIETLSERLSKE